MVKYLTIGPMEWFDEISYSEVDGVDGVVEGALDLSEHEFIEMIGNIAYAETHDYEFAVRVVDKMKCNYSESNTILGRILNKVNNK